MMERAFGTRHYAARDCQPSVGNARGLFPGDRCFLDVLGPLFSDGLGSRCYVTALKDGASGFVVARYSYAQPTYLDMIYVLQELEILFLAPGVLVVDNAKWCPTSSLRTQRTVESKSNALRYLGIGTMAPEFLECATRSTASLLLSQANFLRSRVRPVPP